ncbi:MAG: molybdenum cofactor biosynthesis protein, partial [Myxococcales bacterium]|nr:molybdenum cofactor biosynthesis protein [Myxococcales bacterium]
IDAVRPPVFAEAATADPLLDGFARRIRYLRVSVTDRCNFRCSYCMPETLVDRMDFQPRSAVLTFEEIERVIGVFAKLGVRKIRLTGGEPTVRQGIVELVRRVAAVPGIEQVVMTTNGHLLAELAPRLVDAGLSGVNVSIDTLDAERFRTITSRGDLSRVLAGIDAAVTAGLRVKTNAVALRGINDDEVVALCEDAWRRGAVPRFIEHMPMSDGALFESAQGLSAAAIRRSIEESLGGLVAAAPDRPDAGPARYWALARDPARQVGIISAMTEHFCGDCNRLRLTATGDLHACLGHDDAVSMRDIMRSGGTDQDVTRAIAGAVAGKRAGHLFAEAPPAKHMIGIGG